MENTKMFAKVLFGKVCTEMWRHFLIYIATNPIFVRFLTVFSGSNLGRFCIGFFAYLQFFRQIVFPIEISSEQPIWHHFHVQTESFSRNFSFRYLWTFSRSNESFLPCFSPLFSRIFHGICGLDIHGQLPPSRLCFVFTKLNW